GILNLFISVIIGGIAAIILMIKRKKEEGRTMAFGPYIAIGTYITLMWGNQLLSWYMNTFFY
ncbi:MAG: prepilin peptidase, partial [Clostridium sp.]